MHRAVGCPLLALLASSLACGGSGARGSLGEVGTYDLDAAAFLPGDAAAPAVLDAHIEENHVAVQILTRSCAGDCATVQAVGTGGTPPYTFAWDDGSDLATREVCPAASARYAVTVTDTGKTGELARPPETATASVTADVVACPDGGPDGDDSGAGCELLSTVGPPSFTPAGPGLAVCGVEAGTAGAVSSRVPVQAGQEYEIVTDAMGALVGAPTPWDFYASSSDCDSPRQGQLLGSMTWDPSVPHQSLCFRASADYAYIDWFTPATTAGGLVYGTYQLCRGCSQPP